MSPDFSTIHLALDETGCDWIAIDIADTNIGTGRNNDPLTAIRDALINNDVLFPTTAEISVGSRGSFAVRPPPRAGYCHRCDQLFDDESSPATHYCGGCCDAVGMDADAMDRDEWWRLGIPLDLDAALDGLLSNPDRTDRKDDFRRQLADLLQPAAARGKAR